MSNGHIVSTIGGHRAVRRPLRYDELGADLEYGHEEPHKDLYNYARLECVDCGLTTQGHGQGIDMVLGQERCSAPQEAD